MIHNDNGKPEFHHTGKIIFHKEGASSSTSVTLEIARPNKSIIKSHHNSFSLTIQHNKPFSPPESFLAFTAVIKCKKLQLYNELSDVPGRFF